MTTPHDLAADPLYAVAYYAPIYDTAEAAQAVADDHKQAARDRRDFARSHFYAVRLWPGIDLGDDRVTMDSGYADRIERRYRRNRHSGHKAREAWRVARTFEALDHDSLRDLPSKGWHNLTPRTPLSRPKCVPGTWQPGRPGFYLMEGKTGDGVGIRIVGSVSPSPREGLQSGLNDRLGHYGDEFGDTIFQGVVGQLSGRGGRARFVPGWRDTDTDCVVWNLGDIYESEGEEPEPHRNPVARSAGDCANRMAERVAEEEREREQGCLAGVRFADAMADAREAATFARQSRLAVLALHRFGAKYGDLANARRASIQSYCKARRARADAIEKCREAVDSFPDFIRQACEGFADTAGRAHDAPIVAPSSIATNP